MALNDPSSPLSLVYEMSIEFEGIGTPGKCRTIFKYNDVISGGYRRVDFIAEPSDEWDSLFIAWSRLWDVSVAMTIRHRDETLLALSKVAPTHYAIVPFSASARSQVVALISVCSKYTRYSRASALAHSEFEHYLPESARANVPLKRG